MQKIIDGGMFDSTSVVETVDGFPRGDKAVDAAFFARMMRCFYRDGVLRPTEGAFAVVPASGGITVQVRPGIAWIGGRMAYLDEAASFALTAGHLYTVTLRMDLDLRRFTIEVEEDTGVAPLRTETITELLLARVNIPMNATAVTTAMITDKRTDKTVCGAVDSVMEALQSVAYAANSGAVGGQAGAENGLRDDGDPALRERIGGRLGGAQYPLRKNAADGSGGRGDFSPARGRRHGHGIRGGRDAVRSDLGDADLSCRKRGTHASLER